MKNFHIKAQCAVHVCTSTYIMQARHNNNKNNDNNNDKRRRKQILPSEEKFRANICATIRFLFEHMHLRFDEREDIGASVLGNYKNHTNDCHKLNLSFTE